MNRSLLIKETIRLAETVNRALIAAGCIHRLKDSTGTRTIPVPLEKTRYDPETGMLWVEINPERLPHGFSFSRLRADGLQEKLVELYHRRVVVMERAKAIIIASWIEIPARRPTQSMAA